MPEKGTDPNNLGVTLQSDDNSLAFFGTNKKDPLKQVIIRTDKSIVFYSFFAKNIMDDVIDTIQIITPPGIKVMSDIPGTLTIGEEFEIRLEIDTSRSYTSGIHVKTGFIQIKEITS